MNALIRLPKSIRVFVLVLPWFAMATLRGAEPSVVSFRSVCFDPSASVAPVFLVESGKGRESIHTSKNDIGGPHKCSLREDAYVDFFMAAADKTPSFSVKIPAEGRDRLLVMIVAVGKGHQGSAVSLPATGFDGGSTLAFNLCPVEAAIRQGKGQSENFGPGSRRLLPLPQGQKDDMTDVQILTRKPGGEWEAVQSTRWAVDRRFRSYLFLYPSPKNGRISLLGIPERLVD